MIASDGVFEFLTNQSVADMVAKYPDPLDACKKVVQESYDLWLQYEVRTDDITIICIYIGKFSSDMRRNRGIWDYARPSSALVVLVACILADIDTHGRESRLLVPSPPP